MSQKYFWDEELLVAKICLGRGAPRPKNILATRSSSSHRCFWDEELLVPKMILGRGGPRPKNILGEGNSSSRKYIWGEKLISQEAFFGRGVPPKSYFRVSMTLKSSPYLQSFVRSWHRSSFFSSRPFSIVSSFAPSVLCPRNRPRLFVESKFGLMEILE